MWREGTNLAQALELGPRVEEWLSPSHAFSGRDEGLAALALLSSRWEYWEAYSLAAAFATISGTESGEVIERLAEGEAAGPRSPE